MVKSSAILQFLILERYPPLEGAGGGCPKSTSSLRQRGTPAIHQSAVCILERITDTEIQMKIIKAEVSENRNPSVVFRQSRIPDF